MRLENNGVNSTNSQSPPVNGTKSETHSNGFATRNGTSGKLAGAPEYFGHNREEVTRILIQALVDLGYKKAAETLEDESEYTLESPYVASFRYAVLKGEWSKAESLLYGMQIHQDADINALLFYLRQQKFLELLETRDLSKALHVLRTELTPLNHSIERLHFLSSLMMCLSADDLKHQASWDGATGQSRQFLLSELSKHISPSIMLPAHRLADLLQQVKDSQVTNCLYHNASNPPSLYSDHSCDRNQFPTTTVEVLRHHSNEVYCVTFSNDGTRLASASKDMRVVIWDVETFEPIHILLEHTKDVTYVEWSPDDAHLVSCSTDKTAKLWDSESGICLLTLTDFEESVSSVSWHPDSQSFVTGSMDKQLIHWDLHGHAIRKSPSPRIYDLKITPDGQKLVAVCIDHKLHVYNFLDWGIKRVYDMGSQLTSVTVSRDSRHAVVVTGERGVELVDFETGKVVRRYPGQIQKEFVIRACLGGGNEHFVLSGSEDSNVYVWHKHNGQLVEKLPGHMGTVNCVTWNPSSPTMFASAGDDRTIRIWSRPPQPNQKGKMKGVQLDNGFH